MTVSFNFDYYEEGAKFERTSEVIIYVMNAFVVLLVAIRMVYWYKLNPPRYRGRHFGMDFVTKLLFYACDIWSNVMFTVNFIITMYWFIMYKMQDNAYILMPQRNIENSAYDKFFIF